MGPAVSALIARLMRQQLACYERTRKRLPVLMLIDELPTVALDNISHYMAAMGSAELPSAALRLQERGRRRGDWERLLPGLSPADGCRGARLISGQYGTRLEISPSVTRGFVTGNDGRICQSTRYVAALEPPALMALPPDVVITNGMPVLADRLDLRPLFDQVTP
ncbi:MAG: hypothetical protein IIA89_12240 [Chloroflexi bacterium]|nr:hypothetical protein [Chloroflexota bacterium]